MQIRAMTFNVRGSFHEDGVNNWEGRRTLNMAVLARYTPDIIGFQEAQSGNLEDYTTVLAEYDTEPGPLSIRDTETYHRVPIYWRRDPFKRVDSGGFYLSETPDVWSKSWGSTLVRAVTWVRLRAVDADAEFIVLNTHFPHEQESELARTESARLIVERMREITAPDLPALVMADFNAVPSNEAYQVFTAAGYSDTYRAAGCLEDVNTFHGFMGDAFEMSGLRIDWIFTVPGLRQITTRACMVITDHEHPVYPSDHYPVLAELTLT